MSALDKATSGWGVDMPAWVRALAEECDRTSQNKAAARIGRSGSLVSTVLANKYGGSTDVVEDLVRGALMSETVSCPMLGAIDKKTCHDWRKRAGRFSARNTRAVQMFRACSRCPRNEKPTEKGTEE
ncbi:hypothetical protein J4E08_09955 [Sagittula sp. NFXS13]|uniref:hypothetical protein n=1 Tax=Sagittula sp. NFXS13 TaxID=2819095 RepID=UPI0032E0020A